MKLAQWLTYIMIRFYYKRNIYHYKNNTNSIVIGHQQT